MSLTDCLSKPSEAAAALDLTLASTLFVAAGGDVLVLSAAFFLRKRLPLRLWALPGCSCIDASELWRTLAAAGGEIPKSDVRLRAGFVS